MQELHNDYELYIQLSEIIIAKVKKLNENLFDCVGSQFLNLTDWIVISLNVRNRAGQPLQVLVSNGELALKYEGSTYLLKYINITERIVGKSNKEIDDILEDFVSLISEIIS